MTSIAPSSPALSAQGRPRFSLHLNSAPPSSPRLPGLSGVEQGFPLTAMATLLHQPLGNSTGSALRLSGRAEKQHSRKQLVLADAPAPSQLLLESPLFAQKHLMLQSNDTGTDHTAARKQASGRPGSDSKQQGSSGGSSSGVWSSPEMAAYRGTHMRAVLMSSAATRAHRHGHHAVPSGCGSAPQATASGSGAGQLLHDKRAQELHKMASAPALRRASSQAQGLTATTSKETPQGAAAGGRLTRFFSPLFPARKRARSLPPQPPSASPSATAAQQPFFPPVPAIAVLDATQAPPPELGDSAAALSTWLSAWRLHAKGVQSGLISAYSTSGEYPEARWRHASGSAVADDDDDRYSVASTAASVVSTSRQVGGASVGEHGTAVVAAATPPAAAPVSMVAASSTVPQAGAGIRGSRGKPGAHAAALPAPVSQPGTPRSQHRSTVASLHAQSRGTPVSQLTQ